MNERDQESISVQIIIDRDLMIEFFNGRTIITVFGAAASFDLKLEIKMIDPQSDRLHSFFRNVFFQDGFIAFELRIHAANLRS